MVWLIIFLVVIIIGLLLYVFISERKIKQGLAKEMEGRRTAFVSIISHQLRTPLSVIKGYLEALVTGDQGKLNAGQKEYLDDALKINIETIKLVNDYLAAVRLDSESMPINPQSINIKEMVEEETRSLSLLARAHNCQIFFDQPDQGNFVLKADPVKIRQVIENIIANAIKYSKGKGEVRVSLASQPGTVLFSCRDNGIGIPKNQQSAIFTKFFRARNVISKDTKGSGLGLYLAKMIIEAHQGKIWLESIEDKGTTVFFQLPKD